MLRGVTMGVPGLLKLVRRPLCVCVCGRSAALVDVSVLAQVPPCPGPVPTVALYGRHAQNGVFGMVGVVLRRAARGAQASYVGVFSTPRRRVTL